LESQEANLQKKIIFFDSFHLKQKNFLLKIKKIN